MRVEHHEQFGKIIPPERIDLNSVEEFKEALRLLYEQGYSSILVDCTDLALIDSAGLGSLVMFQKKLKERGGKLKMINVSHRYIKHLFEMFELNRIIEIEII
ncbi:MAG: STAS domain-containing protein [Firmicutes bacterium]|nr:STAS domain-containing protein [Bacillota bacterium]